MAEARAAILAAAPDDVVAAEGEAYLSRVLTVALAPAFIGHHLHEDGLWRPLPCYGGPNPDYIMRHSPIDPRRRYRLEGRMNGSERVGVGLYGIGRNGAPLEIGALIHCAGISTACGDPARILRVNPAATILLVQFARDRVARGGAVVLFASTAAHLIGDRFDSAIAPIATPEMVESLLPLASDPGMAYSISKRGVMLLARREAAAFGARDARIVSLSPGVIDTPMTRAEMKLHPAMQTMTDTSPIASAAQAGKVAEVALFLCSDRASFVTGTDILVDGGSIGSMLATAGPQATDATKSIGIRKRDAVAP